MESSTGATARLSEPDAASSSRPPAGWMVAREAARLALWAAGNLVYMNYAAKMAPRFWWLRRQGRAAEVEAIIEGMSLDWASAAYRNLGCRVEVEGREHVPHEGPLLVLPNHQGLLDIPLLMGWLGRPAGFVYKRELNRFPGMHYWMRQIHSHAVDRAEHRDAVEQYDRWGDELQALRRALVLFPEGTRTRDPAGAIGPFRRGALRLAGPRRIPVLPVVIDGTRNLVRPDMLARTPRGRRVVRMRILAPRMTEPMEPPEAKRFLESLRDEMVSVRESIRVQWD